PREAEAARIRDMDGGDGSSLFGQLRPDAQRVEHAAAGIAQRGGAFIEAGLSLAVGREGLDQCDRQRQVTQRRGEAGAGQSATDDGDVETAGILVIRLVGHAQPAGRAPTSASTSSGSPGTPAVSTSQPPAVTTTSSSMRMPQFQKRRGAPPRASTPPGSPATPAVSTSPPPAVTTPSSSRRMPQFQKRFGTPREPAGI